MSIVLARQQSKQATVNLFTPPIRVVYMNAHPLKTEDNKIAQGILKKSLFESLEIMSVVMKQKTENNIKIVLVGKQVENAFKEVFADAVSYHCIPHPSGRNRKLNSKSYVLQMLQELEAYIQSPNIKPVDLVIQPF